MSFTAHVCGGTAVAAALLLTSLSRADLSDGTAIQKLPRLEVAERGLDAAPNLPPNLTESVTAPEFDQTINVIDAEDAVKYLPSLFVRKRNYGDTQPVIGSRVWGVSSSARSLVYADGVLLSALIANNNTLGAPRWGLVAPAEITRVDVMHGPFSAAYPGNSLGAVVEISTRQPERPEGTIAQTVAWQDFEQYGSRHVFPTTQTALAFGTRAERLSVWVSANLQNSHSQPLSYVTTAAIPAGTSGAYAARNKVGAPANVVGASGLLQTRMSNAKLKLAYELTPHIRAAYTYGVWRNEGSAGAETYLRDQSGAPTFAGLSAFASGVYDLSQQHSMQSFAVRSHTNSTWDFDATASVYRIEEDWQRTPTSVSPTGTALSSAGRVATMDGTGWHNLDLKVTWRSAAKDATHVITGGLHEDGYRLKNPTYTVADWRAGGPATGIVTEGDGNTQTRAAWLQDAWRLAPSLKATFGTRFESWRAYDGFNRNGAVMIHQPTVTSQRVSPKATVTWKMSPQWCATLSVGQAYRFATAAELYQLVSTGTTYMSPQPDLKPDDARVTELKLARKITDGRVRLSLFQDDVHDAIIAQFNPLVPGSTQVYSYLQNVDHVRARGAEFVVEKNNVGLRGLDLSGSVTYVNARTLALSGRPSATAPASAAIGKRLPNIPDWRATLVLTYRPNERWSVTAAGRYSGMMFTTLDNVDTNPNTWQGFGAWFVADARVRCQWNDHLSTALGVDNALNRKYFLFHPFPQRTLVAEAKWVF